MRLYRLDHEDRDLDELLGEGTFSDYWERPDDEPLDPRPGVSCFTELDDLYLYFLRRGCLYVNLKCGGIHVFEGRWSGAIDHDDDEGAVLAYLDSVEGPVTADLKRIEELELQLEREGFDPDEFFRKYDELDCDC